MTNSNNKKLKEALERQERMSKTIEIVEKTLDKIKKLYHQDKGVFIQIMDKQLLTDEKHPLDKLIVNLEKEYDCRIHDIFQADLEDYAVAVGFTKKNIREEK